MGAIYAIAERVPQGAAIRLRYFAAIAAQILAMIVTNRIAFALRFDGREPEWAETAFVQMLPWLVLVRGLTFVPFRLYQGLWRYTSVYDLKALVQAVAVSTVIFGALALGPLGPESYPRSVIVVDAVLLILVLGGVRVARRLSGGLHATSPAKRLLIVGAGDAGQMIAQDMLARPEYQYRPVGFIDDDPAKRGRYIHGVPVLGTRAMLDDAISSCAPDEVLIAIPSAEPSLVREIVGVLEAYTLSIKTLPRLRDILDGRVDVRDIRALQLDDLLARAPVGIDVAPVRELIEGRTVLVTGAGGSIGSELCRQVASMRPATLVMLDRYENGLHAVYLELLDKIPGANLVPVIRDVTDPSGVEAVFSQFRPEIVFHAAAHKHVPLMEANPCEAIRNNVTGTRILMDSAERHGAGRFIFVSTDKAVNPTSVMGASKRLTELVVGAKAAGSRTKFAVVRFGNVIGSNGSVLPRFLEQIRQGGPVTVTHPEMRRFFMLTSEAVQLVLHAAAQADCGGTYVLEMGEQIKLVDLAHHLIHAAGLVPGKDIPITFIGLRPGEKIAEELVGDDEQVERSHSDKILCVTNPGRAQGMLAEQIEELERVAADSDALRVLHMLRVLFPTFANRDGEAAPAAIATDTMPVRPARQARIRFNVERTWPTSGIGADAAVAMVPFVPDRRLVGLFQN